MRSIVPGDIDRPTYWSAWHKQPVSFWQPMLDLIHDRHGISAANWERSSSGKNIVFLADGLVVKLVPPFWSDDAGREEAALTFVSKRLPIVTHTVRATGDIENWHYLVVDRLTGTPLSSIWAGLDAMQRSSVVQQHGELMAALHGCSINDAPSALRFDWSAMLCEQREMCLDELRQGGVAEFHTEQAGEFLDAAEFLVAADIRTVLLHGDLSAGNLLMTWDNTLDWRISGLIDWGDAKLGPASHDLLSPNVNTFLGDRDVLRIWCAGYGPFKGLLDEAERLEHLLMCRTMLYYPDDIESLLQRIPGASQQENWAGIANAFWHLTDRMT